MHKNSKRVLAIGVPLAGIALTGVAFAAWTATGTGSGYAKAKTAQALTTVDATATVVQDLYPGQAAGSLRITIHNPNDYPVRVTSISQDSSAGKFVSSTGGLGTCTDDPAQTPAHPTGVSFTTQSGTWDVAADSDASFLLGGVHMSNASDNNCQGATFTIPVALSGASNAS